MKKKVLLIIMGLVSLLFASCSEINPCEDTEADTNSNVDFLMEESGPLGGETEMIEIADDPTVTENDLVSINELVDNRYTVILNGIPNASKTDLLKKISENIDYLSSGKPIKFINDAFVDADKYSYSYNPEDFTQNYDYGQCWLASASDMLTIGDWAQGLYDPLNNYSGNSDFLTTSFENEDDVFLYLTSNFDHNANFQKNGILFFFDGLFRRYSANGTSLTKQKTNLKNSIGTDQEGLYKDIYAGKLMEEYTFTNNLDSLNVLNDFEEKTYGVGLNFDDNGGHAVTAVGIIIDNEKTGPDKYIAILLADSDNEEDADITTTPESMKSAYEIRKSRANSYTMYGLEMSETSNGDTAVLVKGYKSNVSDKVFLDSVVTLPFKNESVMKAARENAYNATKDARNYADFVADSVEIFKEDYSDETMAEGDDLSLFYSIVNGSDISSLTKENSGADQVRNRIEIIKDGEIYKVIEDALTIDTSNPGSFNEWEGFRGILSLKELGIDLPAGNYIVKLYVNTNNVTEAYVMNNTPAQFSFKIETLE